MMTNYTKTLALGLTAITALMSLSSASLAAPRGGYEELDRRVDQLERRMYEMSRTIDYLQKRVEQLSSGPVYPPYPAPQEPISVCMLSDSFYGKVYLGTGKNRIDAEFAVRSACQSGTGAQYCNNQNMLKCDDNSGSPYVTGHTCLVTDTFYGKIYRGDGRTPVEAEAKSKQSCQSGTGAQYCNVQARCSANN